MNLIITPKAQIKLAKFMKLADNCEICGFGYVSEFNIVDDVKLYEQEGGKGAYVESTEQGVADFLAKNPQPEWILQWHTHPTFAPNPSGTDHENTLDYTKMFKNGYFDAIFNNDMKSTARFNVQLGNKKCRLQKLISETVNVVLVDLPYDFKLDSDVETWEAEAKKDFEDNYIVKKYTPVSSYNDFAYYRNANWYEVTPNDDSRQLVLPVNTVDDSEKKFLFPLDTELLTGIIQEHCDVEVLDIDAIDALNIEFTGIDKKTYNFKIIQLVECLNSQELFGKDYFKTSDIIYDNKNQLLLSITCTKDAYEYLIDLYTVPNLESDSACLKVLNS